MIRTFLAELKYIFTHKWRIVEFILILLTPFMFGFVPSAAMKNPTGHINNLKVAVINKDKGFMNDNGTPTNPNDDFVDPINQGDELIAKLQDENVNSAASRFIEVSDIYADPEQSLVDSGDYSAVIIIPEFYSEVINEVSGILNNPLTWFGSFNPSTQEYSSNNYKTIGEIFNGRPATSTTAELSGINDYFTDAIRERTPAGQILIKAVDDAKAELATAEANLAIDPTNQDLITAVDDSKDKLAEAIKNHDEFKPSLITFYNSYRENYIAGIMGDVKNIVTYQILEQVLPTSNAKTEYIISEMHSIITQSYRHSEEIVSNKYIRSGNQEWGKQAFPQYMMMGLFIGAMATMFLIRNTRHITNASTSRHYFGKTLAFIGISILQTSLLLALMPAAGINYNGHGAGAVFFIYGMSLMFVLFAQALSFMFKKREHAYLMFALLMILSFVSTMVMADLNPGNFGFRIMTFVSPATYGATGLDSIVAGTSSVLPLFSFLAMIAITGIAMIISLEELHVFDKHTKTHQFGEDHYESFNENHELAK